MKRIIITMLVLFSTTAIADQYVQGYTKSNGTYVEPYHRSSPDSSTYNNYSTQGNTNPYTGQQGYQNPVPNSSSYGSQPGFGNNGSSNNYNYGYGR